MELTVLVDNNKSKESCYISEHGLSFYVKDDILYGEIAYYIPTTNESNPDVKVDPNDPSQKQGVG